MDPFRSVGPGERLDINHRAWNWLMALYRKMGGHSDTSGTFRLMNVSLQGKNATGGSVPRFAVLEITGITPAIDAGGYDEGKDQFRSQPSVTVGKPSSSPKRLVIAAEPFDEGAFGTVIVSGVTQCKMHVRNASHQFARAIEDETAKLESAVAGPVEILWSEGEGDDKWALVRLGHFDPAQKRVSWSGDWAYGENKTVTIVGTSNTLKARNMLIGVKTGEGWIAFAEPDSEDEDEEPAEAFLIAVDMTKVTGYDGEADYQALYHRSGKLEWLHDFNCEELEGS